ncbi:MAG: hypothetical protein P9E88_14340 [Candidatus Competibacter sp.]|nr:hypothetical protein [Candidatus Competibacter sp.]
MKLSPSEASEEGLAQQGRELVALLKKGEFGSVAKRFGYSLAFDRDPAFAIQDELASCVSEFQERKLSQTSSTESVVVKYFQPNKSNLFAVVECEFEGPQGCPVLAELIVTANGEERHVCLEQVSIAA